MASPASSLRPLSPLQPAAVSSQPKPKSSGKIDLNFIEQISKPYAGAADQFLAEQEKLSPSPLSADHHPQNQTQADNKPIIIRRKGELEKRAADNPKDTFAHCVLAKFHLFGRQLQKAFLLLEEHVKATDDKSETYACLGSFYLHVNDLDKAAEHYTKGLECDLMNVDAFLGLALCIKRKQSSKQAIEEQENIAQLPTAQPLDKLKLAFVYLVTGGFTQLNKGSALLKEIAEEPPLQILCLYALAETYKAQLKYAEAHSLLGRCLEKLQTEGSAKSPLIKCNLLAKVLASAYSIVLADPKLKGMLDFETLIEEQLKLFPEHPQLLRLKIQVLADKGSKELALQLSSSYFDLYPQDFESWNYRAIALFRMERHQEALNYINFCVNQHNHSAKSRYLRGRIHLALKGEHYQLAFADFYHARKMEPNAKDIHGQMGYCIYKSYHTPSSIKAAFDFFFQEIRREPANMKALIWVSKLYFRLNDYPLCRMSATKLMEAASDHPDAKIRNTARKVYGGALIAFHEYGEAFASFGEILRESPTHLWAIVGQARALNAMKRYKEALELLTKGIEAHPKNKNLWAIRAYTLYHLSEYGPAKEDAERAEALGCNDVDFLHLRNGIFAQLERWEEVDKGLQAIAKLSPNSCVTAFWRGRIAYQNKRIAEAARSFHAAQASGDFHQAGQEFHELVFIYLARTYIAGSSNHRAFETLNKIKDSTNPEYYLARAEYNLNRGKSTEALSLLERYLAEHPKDFRAVLLKVNLYNDRGEYGTAAKVLEAFLALCPDHKEAATHLASCRNASEIQLKATNGNPAGPATPKGRNRKNKQRHKDSPPSPPSPPAGAAASPPAPPADEDQKDRPALIDHAELLRISEALRKWLRESDGLRLWKGTPPPGEKPRDLK